MKIPMLLLIFVGIICPIIEAKQKVLIVFAHQEPQSFCFAMRNRVYQTLVMKGHEVKFSNLVQMGMIGSLDKTDFTELYDTNYFRPQVEQAQANKKNRTTFSKELREEHDKVAWADTMLFIFPYYVMYVPSIMKSWMERVFSYGFAYGDHHLDGKKAMLMYSTGADQAYLKDIEPMFWETMGLVFKFMGVTPLKPFTAYGVQHITVEERRKYLIFSKLAFQIKNKRGKFKGKWRIWLKQKK